MQITTMQILKSIFIAGFVTVYVYGTFQKNTNAKLQAMQNLNYIGFILLLAYLMD